MPASVRLYKESRRLPVARDISWVDYVRKVLFADVVMWISLGLGASSCLLATPSASYIDFKTLACLFCLMAASGGFMLAGLFDHAAAGLAGLSGDTRQLRLFLVFGTFFASMLATNDVALIILVPMTLIAYRRAGCDPTATVILQTIAANVGSSLTPVGNPQNLFLFSFFAMRLRDFLLAVWPVAASGAALLAIVCLWTTSRPIVRPRLDSPRVKWAFAAPFAAVFIIALLAVFNLLDYRLAFALTVAIVLLRAGRVLQQVDYGLLLTFIGFFVFVGNLSALPAVDRAIHGLMAHGAFWVAALASQAISNVPAAVLLSRFTDDAAGLLAGVNAGGCGTLIASMASLISYKLYVKSHGGRRRYLVWFTIANVGFFVAMSAAWRIFGA